MSATGGGYQERSRVQQQSSNRIPSISYQKSQAPGSGANILPTQEEINPMAQAENYVSRPDVGGAKELEWSKMRMKHYEAARNLRLDISKFRHELLKKVVLESGSSSSSNEKEKNIISNTIDAGFVQHLGIVVSSPSTSSSASSGQQQQQKQKQEEQQILDFLTQIASPEQIEDVLSEEQVTRVEEQVDQYREAKMQEFIAKHS